MPHPRTWLARYGFAVAAVVAATAVRLALHPALGSRAPFFFHFLAVLLTGWYAGFGPGVVGTLLSAAAVWGLFLPSVDDPENASRLVLFVILGFCTALYGGVMVAGRRRAEAAAREADRQREQLRTTLASIGDAVIVTDAEGLVTILNPVAEALTGWPAAEAGGRPLAEVFRVVGEDTRGPVEGPAPEALREGRVAVLADRTVLVARDGAERSIDARAAPVRGGAGGAAGVVLTFRDVTGQKRADAARRRAAQNARFLADASAALADLVDPESTLQKVARLAVPAFADWCVVDIREGDAAVRRVAVAHADPGRGEFARVLSRTTPDPAAPRGVWQVIRSGRSVLVPDVTPDELAATTTDPDRRRVLLALGARSYIGVPLAARGAAFGAVTFVAAESGRRYDEADRAVAEDLARRAATAIENARLYQALREADRRKDEFLATLAHELRNPLAPLRNGLYILTRSGADPGTVATAVAVMGRQIEYLVRLVDDLLDVSRIMRGKIELRKEPLDLTGVVARAVETVRPAVDAEGHALVLDLPPEPLRLDGDPVRLAQVVANLLGNAAKYTDRGGTIRLTARREGDRAVVRVRDTGIGIRPEMLPHVFDMFVQADRRTRASQGGMGIGLTLVRSLVGMHGGTVEAASDGPGHGSEFVVRLPLAPDPEPAADGPSPGTLAPNAVTRNVLVVDDNTDAAESLAVLLRLAGHAVRVAYAGPAALSLAEADPPELAFLDIGMPGMDGLELARRFRADPRLRGTVLVALTGWGQEEDRRRTKDAGFDHHLTKPADLETLTRLFAAPAGEAAGVSYPAR